MKRLILSILFLVTLALSAQNPWVGGLNACQFGRMDLDGDGQKDLLVFDRHGDRLLCYLNKGAEGEIHYEHTSVYDTCFPKLSGWAVFADFDGDGREDIFTYSKGWAGIKVYRNLSHLGEPQFELLVSPYLTSWQGGGEVNILATDADYPAVVDLDGDGDLDILTFGVMGNFIEKHTNLSMERYGHPLLGPSGGERGKQRDVFGYLPLRLWVGCGERRFPTSWRYGLSARPERGWIA